MADQSRRATAFQDCRDRLDRAQAHRDAFNDGWKALLKRRQQTLTVRVQRNGTGSIWVQPPPLPVTLGLELGEMMYQLRATLDACVYRAAVLDSRRDPPPYENALEFPVCITEANWQDSVRRISPLSDEHRKIIEEVQPYHADEYPGTGRIIRSLGILNDWARKDRHRRLHVVRAWLGPVSPRLIVTKPARLVHLVTRQPGFVEGATKLADFNLDGYVTGTRVKATLNVPFNVAVDEIPEAADPSDTLERRIAEMFYAVREIIERFERTFEAPYPIRIPRVQL